MGMVLILLSAIIAVILAAYTQGNQLANDLMVKLRGPTASITFWERGLGSTLLPYLLFWITPCVLIIIFISWWGLIYLPMVFLIASKTSYIFLKRQLRQRWRESTIELAKVEEEWREAKKRSKNDDIKVDIKQHEYNELIWLMNHPKLALQIAVSDDQNIDPRIAVKFETHVQFLDSTAKKERQIQSKE